MKRSMRQAASLFAVVALTSGIVMAQTIAIGTPAWGSFGGGPFDVINLGNLNIHFVIPVLHKAGRGIPLMYDITYDSTVWHPGTVNGVSTWQPAQNAYWGFQGLTIQAAISNLTYSITQSSSDCGQYSNIPVTTYQFTNLVYTDNHGAHNIPFSPVWIQTNGTTDCPPNGPQPSTQTTIALTDGSGLTFSGLLTGSNSISWNVSNPSGTTFFNGSTGVGQTDANGNTITPNSDGSFTDTLGQTALTVSGVAPNNTTLAYVPPSDESTARASAAYTVNYATYTVTTNFGCSGIAEYSAQQSLINKISLPDGTYYQFTYEPTANESTGQVTGRLSSVRLPTSAVITYTYATTNSGANNAINCSDGSVAATVGSTPSLTRVPSGGGTWTYSRTQGTGNQWTTTVTDPSSSQTVITFQENTLSSPANFYETERQRFQGSASGTPLETSYTCYNTASPTPTICPTTAVSLPISRVTTFVYFPDSSGEESETDIQYSYVSDPGYPTEVDSYDFGSGKVGSLLRKVITAYNSFGNAIRPTSVQVEDGSNVLASTTYSYDQTGVKTTSGTPQHVAISGGRGNLTTLQEQIATGAFLYKDFSYYDTGVVYQATDWGTSSSGGSHVTKLNMTSAAASCGNAFATSVSEPVGLSRSFTLDCVGGVQTSVSDENGQTSTTYYAQTGNSYGSPDSSFWRPYAITDQLSNATSVTYPTSTTAESALLFNSNTSGVNQSVVDQRTKVDGFGRPILTEMREGPSSSNYESTQTVYDSLGLVSKRTLPFTSTVDAACSGTCPGVTYTYDALNRPLQVKDGGGDITAYTYTKNDILQVISPAPTGEHTKQKLLEYDGLGRLVSVCEITSATGSGPCGQTVGKTGFLTKYTYNGNTIRVTQNAQAGGASQQMRSFTYDMVGRLSSETNPESGTKSYVYDSDSTMCGGGAYTSAGDLVKITDAANNCVMFYYDALHRLTDVGNNSESGANVCKRFRYDNSTVNGSLPSGVVVNNAIGRLTEAETDNCATWPPPIPAITDEFFSYSARGEVQDVWEKTPDSGGFYHVNAQYWASGSLNVLNGGSKPLPALPAITYGASDGSGLDGKGRITKVTANSGQNPVASGISWNVADQVTGVTFGSGDDDGYQYDANTGRMTQYQFELGTAPQTQTGVLTWNANGTLQKMQITDQINAANSQTCTYGYDDLSRITSANCGSVWSQTFGYDPFGNLSKSGSAQFLPTYTGATGAGSPTNQYYQIPGGAAGPSNYYDADGNLTNDLTHSYTWDVDSNMTSVDGSTVTMTYDAFDRMVEQTRGSSHTQIAYGPDGMKLALMNGQSLVSAFVKLPGGARAVYKSSGLAYYRHSDHLGSSRLATTPSRTKYYDVAYAPYGEDYNGSGTQDMAFTDENQDTASGGWSTNLYDFMYREYRTAHGRWTSADPAGLSAVDPTNPQTWNRYAYVLNNPLSYVDPTGLDCAYLNDSGDSAESIDHSSDQGECWSNGGYWADGYIGGSSWVQTFSNSDNVIIDSSVNGFLGQTLAGSLNNGGTAFSQLFGLNASVDAILSNPFTPTNYVDPMAPSARQMLRAIAAAAPTVCGGGVFAYGGRSLDVGPANAFAGVIIEADSVSGTSKGALFEAGGGEGITGGGGVIVANNGGGLLGSENLAYGGAGVGIPGAHVGGGVVGFTGGIGGYGEIEAGGKEVGVGAYLNITNNAGCKQR